MAKGSILSGSGTLKLAYAYGAGEFDRATETMREKIQDAGAAAMKETQIGVKVGGRRAIAGGGFGRKWQNAFRVNLYPKRGRASNPAVFAYHKIPYAGVFEKGAVIKGKPVMWLPLPHIPKKMGGRRTTPESYAKRFGKMITITSPKGHQIILGRRSRRKGAQLEPIFVGLTVVTIRKKFDLDGVFTREANRIPQRYANNLKV